MNFLNNIKSQLTGLSITTVVGFIIILFAMSNMISTNQNNASIIQQIEHLKTSTNQLKQIAMTQTRGDHFETKYKETNLIYQGIQSQTNLLDSFEKSLKTTQQTYTLVSSLQKEIDDLVAQLKHITTNIDEAFSQVHDYKVLFYFTHLKLSTKTFIKEGEINLAELRKTQTKFRNAVRGSEAIAGDMEAQQKITAQIVEYRKILSLIIEKDELIQKDKSILKTNMAKTMTLIEEAKKALFEEVNQKNKEVIILTFLVAILLVVVIVAITYLISKRITINLKKFERGLYEFFDVISHKQNKAQKINITNKDEIAQMAEKVNQNIEIYTTLINHNKEVLQEANDILQKVANGFYGYKISHHENVSPEVKELIININKMLDQTKHKFTILNNALYSFGKYDFDYTIPRKEDTGLCGDFGTLVASTKLIGNNVSEFLAMIVNTGDQLNLDTSTLSTSATDLSNASITQASSLEETAAALEQITANINTNNSNVSIMSHNAQELFNTSIEGQQLALQTASSMDQIDAQVIAISEAIKIIDQITFQTNILSLNAAVEAATAGEAGKGFAVVAGEVRNLASRSADAANEIKQLVQKATSQTSQGKIITNQMREGYEQLANKISETTQIIQNVATASKEQQLGIIQINDAIAKLDQNTQINAQNAQHISDLAHSISELSQDLLNLSTNAKFKERIKNQVCDITLVHETSQIKNDHIELKSKAIENVGDFKAWDISTEQECKMGQWIQKCEKENLLFTRESLWKEIKETHHNIHQALQTYINENANKAPNSQLALIAQEIENNTLTLFDKLDDLKILNCKLLEKVI